MVLFEGYQIQVGRTTITLEVRTTCVVGSIRSVFTGAVAA